MGRSVPDSLSGGAAPLSLVDAYVGWRGHNCDVNDYAWESAVAVGMQNRRRSGHG
jgi:hypothetical protein